MPPATEELAQEANSKPGDQYRGTADPPTRDGKALQLCKAMQPCVPWAVKGHGLPDDEFEFALVDRKIQPEVLARLVCESAETPAASDVLRGLEYPMPECIVDLVKGHPVIDIGGHIGSSSLYFDVLCEPETIVTFEPSQRACEYIQRNSRGSKHGLVQAAVAGHTGTTKLWERRGAMFISSIFEGDNEPSEGVVVPAVSGEEALNSVGGEIGVLKIDAEGCGVLILLSAAYQLQRVMVIYVEYHTELHRRLIDEILKGFVLFYSQAGINQGVLGYLNHQYYKEIHDKTPKVLSMEPLTLDPPDADRR